MAPSFFSSLSLSPIVSLPPSSLSSLCKSTPYPNQCFTSLKPLISSNISPNIIIYLLQFALSEAHNLSNTDPGYLVETQKGAIQDCRDVHEITLVSLQRTASKMGSSDSKKHLTDARVLLSPALTNKATPPNRPMKRNKRVTGVKNRRKLMEFPSWLSANARRILDDDDDNNGDEQKAGIMVAKDGSGHFTTISDAINFAPNNSDDRVIIYVKSGVYEENVEIQSHKTNIVLLGDGSDVTVVTGNGPLLLGMDYLPVSDTGFLARDITFQNTVGPAKNQAPALRINADCTGIYKCVIDRYQDTLHAHSFRQFYRECDIYGTIDYICGNAGAVFQACNIVTKMPMPGQGTVITAQSRDSPNETTAGFSLQNRSIITTSDFDNNNDNVKSYLGRPWGAYSRTVFMESWSRILMVLSIRLVGTSGPLTKKINWRRYIMGSTEIVDLVRELKIVLLGPGYHVMEYEDPFNFTVSELISGEQWLDSTSFPFDDGV